MSAAAAGVERAFVARRCDAAVLAIMVAVALCAGPRLLATRGDAAPRDARLRINPNTASPAELALVPGIGPKLAQNIVTSRTESPHEPAFARAEDLDRVPRVGPTLIEAVRPYLTFDAPRTTE